MLARNETILKWVLYAAATVLCLAVQEMFLQRFTRSEEHTSELQSQR